MIKFLRKKLGIQTLEEKAERYVGLQKELEISKGEIDELASSFSAINNTFKKGLIDPDNSDSIKLIQDRFNMFLIDHTKEIKKAKDKYFDIQVQIC